MRPLKRKDNLFPCQYKYLLGWMTRLSRTHARTHTHTHTLSFFLFLSLSLGKDLPGVAALDDA